MTSRIVEDDTMIEDSICIRYYISSAELTAKEFANASRGTLEHRECAAGTQISSLRKSC